MKFGPVTKLDKKNKAMSKQFDVIAFFQFVANFEPSGSRIPHAFYIKLTFSITKTFVLQKLKRELKNLYHSSHTITLSKGTIFAKKY